MYKIDNQAVIIKLLKSAFETQNLFMETDAVVKWMEEQNNRVQLEIKKIPFKDLKLWKFDENSLRHETGKFFSIDGINVKTNWGHTPNWDQPIINQPEVGYLGFIAKEINGVLHFLCQAKIEPGNVNFVQLSPTLQATRSNYTQIHNGKRPAYLEYFQNAKPHQILLDQLQSEQGARFLRKRNRNIIVLVEEEIVVFDNFVWLTLSQLKELMRCDNLVNMDARTVISGINFGNFNSTSSRLLDFCCENLYHVESKFLKSILLSDTGINSIENIITKITNVKSSYDLVVKQIPLKHIRNWVVDNEEIYHEERKYFSVIGVEVEISNREVKKWYQPMVEPAHEGLCAFVCKEIDGIIHFAVQLKLECGNLDIIEFAPTVQTVTGDYKNVGKNGLPFLDYVLNVSDCQVLYNSIQSEEGGRFYREQNRNLIVLACDEFATELPENFIWLTLNQLQTFMKFNNYVNIQARNLISLISFVK
jgi:oxidase EvaA